MRLFKFKRAVTLLELIVVITVIGILASFSVATFSTAQQKGRDAKRKEALSAISSALILYYQDFKNYPPQCSPCTDQYLSSSTPGEWITGLGSYMNNAMPKDPTQASISSFLTSLFSNLPGKSGQDPQVASSHITTEFSDAFTGSNGTNLDSHTPNIGTGWDRRYSADSGRLDINTNQLRPESTNSSDGAVYTTRNSFSGANYQVSALAVDADDTDDTTTLFARYQAATGYTYGWMFSSTAGGTYNRLFKRTSAGFTTFAVTCTPVSDGTTVTLEVIDSSIRALQNSAVVCETTDSSITAIGLAGIGYGMINSSYNSGHDLDVQKIDDFKVDVIGALPTPSPSPIVPTPTPLPTPTPTPTPPATGSTCTTSTNVYCYFVPANRQSFVLWTQLENDNDADIYPSDKCDIDPQTIFGAGTPYNYCVKSPAL